MPQAAILPAAMLGGSILSGVLGGNAQKSAANTAAQAQQQATAQSIAAQQQSAAQQLAFYNNMYNQNLQNSSPFMASGTGALNIEDKLLGITPQTAAQFNTAHGTTPAPANLNGTPAGGPAAAPVQTGPSLAQIMAMQHDGVPGNFKAALAAYNASNPTAQVQAPSSGGGGLGSALSFISPAAFLASKLG